MRLLLILLWYCDLENIPRKFLHAARTIAVHMSKRVVLLNTTWDQY